MGVACGAVGDDVAANHDGIELFNRLWRLQREMECSVAEEDYAKAVQLRDASKALLDTLSPVQQFMYQQTLVLRNPDASPQERAGAVSGLGTSGDSSALPHLSSLLADPGAAKLHDAAQSAMWSIFMRCQDPSAQAALLEGTALMGKDAAQEEAMRLFDHVVQQCPTHAEGYNKIATLLYLQRQFRDSIKQCLKAIELQPYHFGAASGMGLCHLQLGEYEQAVAAFDIALSINPTMTEIRNIHDGLKKSIAEAAAEEAAEGAPNTSTIDDQGSPGSGGASGGGRGL